MTPQTLAGPARHAIEVRKSRFIAQAAAAATPEAAAGFIAHCADPDARHNCWAWRVGARYRFHDANEPAGTAGRPILMAIDSQGLDQVAVVVTRFYGGIKLGARGPWRGYGGGGGPGPGRTAPGGPGLPHLPRRGWRWSNVCACAWRPGSMPWARCINCWPRMRARGCMNAARPMASRSRGKCRRIVAPHSNRPCATARCQARVSRGDESGPQAGS